MRKWPIVALAIVMAGAAVVSGLADVVVVASVWAGIPRFLWLMRGAPQSK